MSKNCTFNHIFTLSDYMSLQEISPLKTGGKKSIIWNKILFTKRNNSFRKESDLNSLHLFLPSLLNTRITLVKKGKEKCIHCPPLSSIFIISSCYQKQQCIISYLLSNVEFLKVINMEMLNLFIFFKPYPTNGIRCVCVCVCVCFFFHCFNL